VAPAKAAQEPVEEPVTATPEPAKAPPPSEAELRTRVEANLSESGQMLEELREHASGAAAQPASSGTLEIMAEGLEEVRELAARKEWAQARDKADALHAQLKLLLQTVRRAGPS
jgi:hypothetical protein